MTIAQLSSTPLFAAETVVAGSGFMSRFSAALPHTLRIWVAMALALYAAFWLELASPGSALVTVGILAQPRRGHALSRSFYRFTGTIVGGVGAILLAALFGQERTLFLGAFTLWLGACVFVAAYLPGDRAYGAVLSGYTVALISLNGIDAPQSVFTVTTDRVAAISVGIAAVALVNLGAGSPRIVDGLQGKVRSAVAAVRGFVSDELEGRPHDAAHHAALLAVLIGLRDETRLIGSETTTGRNRAAGARRALAALSQMAFVSRMLGAPRYDGIGDEARRNCIAIGPSDPAPWDERDELRSDPASTNAACVVQLQRDFNTARLALDDGMLALQTGSVPHGKVELPVHRDIEVAVRDALRIMVAFGASAAFYVAAGWPATSVALSLVATLCALSATSPSQAKFATGALISLPIAIVLVAVIRFAVFDGSQSFLGLIVALGPITLLSSYFGLQPALAGIGALLNVFVPTLLAPSNPQSYDLQAFLTTSVLVCSSVTVLALSSRLVLRVTPTHRLAWALRSGRRDLADAIRGGRRSAGDQRSRSDDQIAQVAAWAAAGARNEGGGLPNIIAMSDITVVVADLNSSFRTANLHAERLAARRSLAAADTDALRHAAETLLPHAMHAAVAHPASALRAIAGLNMAAGLIASARTQAAMEPASKNRGVIAVLDQVRKRSSLVFRVTSYVASSVVLVAAILGGVLIWDSYMNAPWTRDGQVRVQTVRVAPRVSGEILRLGVADNQAVHKGDLLYVVDPFDYAVAFASADAELNSHEADLAEKENRNERRRELTTLSTSVEEKQQFDAAFKMASAAVADSRAKRSQAQVNLRRTEIRSPVNGFITNLLLREGDYATAGSVNVAVIDSDSYWVDGYFEETKLERIQVGDTAMVRLMGYSKPVRGVVESLTRGISSAQAASNVQGLPNVDPVYTWVRLAQRIPVRIHIIDVPPGVPLVAGMTCSVTIVEPPGRSEGLFQRLMRFAQL